MKLKLANRLGGFAFLLFLTLVFMALTAFNNAKAEQGQDHVGVTEKGVFEQAHPGYDMDLEIATVEKNLQQFIPENMQVISIEPTQVQHVYMANLGSHEVFVFASGDYLMLGDVFNVNTKENLGDARKAATLVALLDAIPESEMIMMGEPMARFITVFTDTDCYYCQQFHQTVATLQAHGLQVRYVMFPRAGVGSESYDEAVSVWCADNQAEAMTIAKAGGRVTPRTCENPVKEQYFLGQSVGIQGTPTMILDNGKMIIGFQPPERLLAEAGIVMNGDLH